jgi:CxxC motif-containing protein
MKEIDKISLKAPVKIGDVVIHDLVGSGVDLIATRDMPVVK